MRYLNFLTLSLSMSTAALASQPIEIDSPTAGRKVFRNLEELEKGAWSAAQAGEFERAGRYLRHAAAGRGCGSRVAALFLAHEYRNGGLIFQQNANEAESMQRIYDDLKAKEKDQFWTSYDGEEVKKHGLRIKNSALARATPWLAAAYSLIQAKSSDGYKKVLEQPSSAVGLLLDTVFGELSYSVIIGKKLAQDETERAVEIIHEGIFSLNDQALFSKVFQILGKGQCKVDFLEQFLTIAHASPFHTVQEKTDLEMIVHDNVTCLQSEWYPQLVELCTDKSSHTKRKNPFELVKDAINILVTNKELTEEKRAALFAICGLVYKQVQSVSLKSGFASALDMDGWGSHKEDAHCLRLLKIIVADEALRTHKWEELVKRTHGVMDSLYGTMLLSNSYEDREKAHLAFFDCFEILYDLDPAQSPAWLKERYSSNDEWSHRDFRLDILLALKGRDEEFFQTESHKILSEHLDALVSLLISSPERKRKAEGTMISMDAAFSRMCQVLSSPSQEKDDKQAENAQKAFEKIVTNNVVLEAYGAQLSPQLGAFLIHHDSLCYRYSDLLGLGSVALRDAAFQALLTLLANANPESRAYYPYTSTADDLFKPDRRKFGYISDKSPTFFKGVFEALSADRADYPIQRMWQSMDAREPEVRQEMLRQIRTYFKLPIDSANPSDEEDKRAGDKRGRSTPTFSDNLNQTIKECIDSNSLSHSALHQFCEVAKATGIYTLLPAEVLVYLGDLIFWNEEASLPQRSEAFNNILRRSAAKGELANLRAVCQERLQESALLSYVSLAIQMIEVTPKTSQAMYALMGKMIDLKKAHPEICIPNDFILKKSLREQALEEGQLSGFTWSPRDFTWLYNMKKHHSIGRHDENAPYVAIDSSLSSLSLDEEGSLYGVLYDCNMRGTEGFNYYRFYKCDPYTGYAKWSMILSHNPKAGDILDSGCPEYTVGSNYVYVISGNNQVVVFDKTNGEYVRDLIISDVDPNVKLSFIGAVGDNLFAAAVWESGSREIDSKASLSFLPLGNAQGSWSLNLPQTGGGRYRFSTNGTYFVCTGYGSSVKHFINASGKKLAIDGDPNAPAKEHFKHAPAATVDGDMLFYTQKQADKSFQLVHLNLVTGDELWRAPLIGEPKQAPVLSVARDCVFMLSAKDLCALSIRPAAPGTLLWQVSTGSQDCSFFNKIDHIEVSSDGRYVYGLESNIHTFYRYDVKTGAEEGLGKFSHGRSAALIGSRADGKVFIKPHYY